MALPTLTKFSLTGWIPKLIGLGVVILILAIGAAAIYYVAYNKGENISKVEIEKFQRDVAELNARNLERERVVTERVIERYHTTTIQRQPIIYNNREIIRTRVPEGGNITRGAAYAHDQSARGEAIDAQKAADARPSNTNERELITVVNENYDISRANADRQNALIDWTLQQQKAQDEKATSR